MMAWIIRGKKIYDKYKTDEMTVYAAQVSFFVMLSFVPFIMLLLTAVQMIPAISQAEVLELVVELTPADYKSLAFRIVNDLSLKSPATMISVTAVTALWSAGRGLFSMARGLDRVWGKEDKYWYVISRLICCGYTIVFVAVCLLSLILLVFGQILQGFLEAHFPFVGVITGTFIDLRAIWFFLVLFVFFLGIYTFVPEKRLRVRDQIPGALFSTLGWLLFSFAFSIYFNRMGGGGYSYMYGSLAAIVLLLLWLYFCLCILFLGAEINYFWTEHREFMDGRAEEQIP